MDQMSLSLVEAIASLVGTLGLVATGTWVWKMSAWKTGTDNRLKSLETSKGSTGNLLGPLESSRISTENRLKYLEEARKAEDDGFAQMLLVGQENGQKLSKIESDQTSQHLKVELMIMDSNNEMRKHIEEKEEATSKTREKMYESLEALRISIAVLTGSAKQE